MRGRLRRFLAIAIVSAFLPAASVHALTWVEVAQLTHAGGSEIGYAVAIDGDVAVTGDSIGIVRVFVRSGGLWAEAAGLVPSATTGEELFGASVAIRGDTIAVGSPASAYGRIYVFVRPNGGWSGILNENARLDATAFGQFRLGDEVAFAGDSIVTGTGLTTVPNILFVFNKPGSGWSGTVGPSAFLHCSLNGYLNNAAGSGDVIVAGSPLETLDAHRNAGKAFVWVKPAVGWSGFISNAAELLPSDPIDEGRFGASVGIDGTSVVVTSMYPVLDTPPTPNKSKGYVFQMPSSGWAGSLTEKARLVGSDVVNGESFGRSTSISAGTVVIGAPEAGFSANQPGYGAAYVFDRPASGWSGTIPETAEFFGPQALGNFGDFFGVAVAISGGTIVVGSPFENVAANVEQGVAHVFESREKPFHTQTRFIEGPIRVLPGVPVEFAIRVEVLGRAQVEAAGAVLVEDGVGQECRAFLDATGEGSCALSFPSGGTYRVQAHFLGNSEFGDSASPPLRVRVDGRGG